MNHRLILSDSELKQVLYCMEQMFSDYTPGTDDEIEFSSALRALQNPQPE